MAEQDREQRVEGAEEGLSEDELAQEQGAALPDREAMSVMRPGFPYDPGVLPGEGGLPADDPRAPIIFNPSDPPKIPL